MLAVGIGLRFWARSELWLDEALTVNIAQLPIGQIPEALRHDGAPPAYYLLLHAWMGLFGTGNVAVRSLSGVFAVATLPLIWLAGRRAAGKAAAWGSLMVLASSPFAIRYATEARMYSLLALLAVLGYLALSRALEHPSPGRLAGLAAVSGLLTLTHYWSFYLLGAAAVVLAFASLPPHRGPHRRAARRSLASLAAGGLLFVPWLPIFLFQLRHTGTPWNPPASFTYLLTLLDQWSGGGPTGTLLSTILLGLIALALFARPSDHRGLEFDLRAPPAGREVAFVGVGTLTLAALVGLIAQSGFQARYTSLVLPLFLLLAGIGIATLPTSRTRHGAVALVVLLGLGSAPTAGSDRTQAAQVAAAIRRAATEGDVIGYCPDQLGPAVSRLLPNHFRQLTFPAASSPRFVDWVDYEKRNRAGDARAFARALLRRAGDDRNVWLVSSSAYTGPEYRCDAVRRALLAERPQGLRALAPNSRYLEREELALFPAVHGYSVLTSDGRIHAFEDATSFDNPFENLEGKGFEQAAVGFESTPSGRGWWVVASDGTVLPFGDARLFGSRTTKRSRAPVVGMASSPSGRGYWLATADGNVVAHGNARRLGTLSGTPLNSPIVSIAATSTGKGYWLFASDGGVFTFGDAPFRGSATSIEKRFVSADSVKGGDGYWLLASEGSVFPFGSARFFGSGDILARDSPWVSMAGAPSDRGYWLVAADGAIFPFGAAKGSGQKATLVPEAVQVEGWGGKAERATRSWRHQPPTDDSDSNW